MKRQNLAVKTFDYTPFDGDTKGKLITLAGQICRAKGGLIKSAMEMGEAISWANDVLATSGCKGRFGAWVEDECGICRKTAYNYMWAWERFQKCEALSRFDDGAMYLLAAPTVPKEASKEAEKLADKGARITLDVAREIIGRHRPAAEPTPEPEPSESCNGDTQFKDDSVAENADPQTDRGEVPAAEPTLADDDTSFDPDAIESAPHPTVDINGLATPYRNAVRTLGALIKEFEAIAHDQRTGAHLVDKFARLKHDLKEAITTISQSEPVVVCEKCDGQKCNACAHTGFWTRSIRGSRK